jgi:hypothetical protein
MASRIELIDTLCSEEPEAGTPFSLDYLYWLEGLTYPELMKLSRAHEKGADMPLKPSLQDLEEMPATIRRHLAEAMGVPRDKSGEFAGANVEKAKTLDTVARSLLRAGVQIPAGRAELLQVSTVIYASMVTASIGGDVDNLEVSTPEPDWAVGLAEGLIAAVNARAGLKRAQAEQCSTGGTGGECDRPAEKGGLCGPCWELFHGEKEVSCGGA